MSLDPRNLPYIALTISIVALCFTVLNASLGILNFVLSRFRLLRVRELRAEFGENRDGRYHALEVDVVSYGASIFDLEVTVEVFVRPSSKTIGDQTVGTTSLSLTPVGQLPNPLNAGKGARFHVTRRAEGADEHTQHFFNHMQAAFKAARLSDVCIKVTCSEGRKVLKRIRGHNAMQQLDWFLGKPRNIKWTLWQRAIGYFEVRRITRENKRWGSVASMATRTAKNRGESTTSGETNRRGRRS